MRIVERQSDRLVCRHGSYFVYSVAAACIVAGVPILSLSRLAGAAFIAIGVVVFARFAEDNRIVLDGAAGVVQVMRWRLARPLTITIPCASIRDVALEKDASWYAWRPVFICTDGQRIPWMTRPSIYRDPLSRAVAAARATGAWDLMPVQGPPTTRQVARSLLLTRLLAMGAMIPILMRASFAVGFVPLFVLLAGQMQAAVSAASRGVDAPVI